MSRTYKRRERPSKVEKLTKKIEQKEKERGELLLVLRLTQDAQKKRVCYVRAEDCLIEIKKLREDLQRARRRCNPAQEQPLFKFNNKEV